MADGSTDFRAHYGPWALVAGASDGIGESFARQLAERGLNVLLLARREALLETLAADLSERYGVEARPLVADLTELGLGEVVARATSDLEVGLLVYNAGAVHGARHFHDQPLEHALGLVNLNCRGPVLLSHLLGQPMRERGRGGIILLGSISGASGSAYTTTYAATKSFDLILAEGLWHELAPAGVHVMCAIAGATRTPSMLNSTEGFDQYPGLMEPEDVARGALEHLGKGPSWVAGEANRQAAKAMWPVSKVPVINAMSRAASEIYDLPHTEVKGVDFQDEG